MAAVRRIRPACRFGRVVCARWQQHDDGGYLPVVVKSGAIRSACPIILPSRGNAIHAVGPRFRERFAAESALARRPMRSQLVQRTIDHRHADELAAALALPEHFDCDRLGRFSRTHVT